MEISSELIARFVHDTVKPVKSMIMRLEIMEKMPDAIKDDPAGIKVWRESFDSVRQALEDLQFLSACDQSTEAGWEDVDWKALITDQVERSNRSLSDSFKVNLDPVVTLGRGDKRLIRHAFDNMRWFTTHFGNRLLTLSLNQSVASQTTTITYDFETDSTFDPVFEQGTPFTALSGESLALTHNSGLILYSVKKVTEIHQGGTKITREGNRASIRLWYPLNRDGGK